MGCWYETCAITRTPILGGEEVVMIVVSQEIVPLSRGREVNRLESYNIGRTVESIHFGKYNDYGWIEGVSGDTSPNMEERTAGRTEAYERSIFVRKSVWDHVLAVPAFDENFNKSILHNIESQRLSSERYYEEDAKPDGFWHKIIQLATVMCFCDQCRIDILCGLNFKGSQYHDHEAYDVLSELDKIARSEWSKKEEEFS